MTEALPIELRKIAYRQSAKDGLVITFAVHPDDMPTGLAAAPIGARFMAALVEIGDDEMPVEKREVDPTVRRAGILCNDRMFQNFLLEGWPLDWDRSAGSDSERAAFVVRQLCEIQSRKELATNPQASAAFETLTAKFEMWKRGENP